MISCDNGDRSIGIALVGNPGAGKSTILNGIAGKSTFPSGISLGTGLTSVVQKHVCEEGGLTLYDTPGLADMETRKKAGEELDKVLKEDMSIKLAFVVTLERGRVKPDDASTIKLILQAIKSVDVNNMFGVIINQLSAGEMKYLKEDPEKAAKVQRGLTGAFFTSHWVYVQKADDLEDAKDGKLMNKDLLTFLTALPETKPPDAEVEKIDTSDMYEKIEEQARRIRELENANEQQRLEMVKQIERQAEEARIREKETLERLDRLQRDLDEARKESALTRYKNRKILTGIWNTLVMGAGTGVSLAIANPAPLIAAGALVRAPKKPNVLQGKNASSNVVESNKP